MSRHKNIYNCLTDDDYYDYSNDIYDEDYEDNYNYKDEEGNEEYYLYSEHGHVNKETGEEAVKTATATKKKDTKPTTTNIDAKSPNSVSVAISKSKKRKDRKRIKNERELTSMGFSSKQANLALERNSWDVQKAINYLKNNIFLNGTAGTAIKNREFSESPTLETVEILPDSHITSIGGKAFSDCELLRSVYIADGVTSISWCAFRGCGSLKTIRVPDSVTNIASGAFHDCASLELIHIPKGVTNLSSDIFHGCESLQSIRIPDGVKYIGESAFDGCTSLQSILIPDGVRTIGKSAFNDCASLRSIHIPNSVRTIGDYAFCGCTSLQLIYLPKSGCRHIGKHTFLNCNTLDRRQANSPNFKYHSDTTIWLRRRFDNLPIHQACLHYSNGINTKSILLDSVSALICKNKQSLAATDAMGMTALHTLCCNPHTTIKMVQIMVEKDPSILAIRDISRSTPLELFLRCRGFLGAKQGSISLFQDVLQNGIEYDDLEHLLVLNSDLESDLSIRHESTGLIPFMTALATPACGLDVAYALAIRSLSTFLIKM